MRFAAGVPVHGNILDVACGSGRHSRYFAARGHAVDSVDRDTTAFVDPPDRVNVVCADIEHGAWPFSGKQYAAVVVTNYLHRPLMPQLLAAVAPQGLLIYETFAAGNERYGRPTRAEFLLRPNELTDLIATAPVKFEVLAYENVFTETPKPAMVQRIAARRVE